VIKKGDRAVDAVECKVNPDKFDPEHLEVFRSFYPDGRNYVVSPMVKEPYNQRRKGMLIRFCGMGGVGRPDLRRVGT
jgi:hypothetical protein